MKNLFLLVFVLCFSTMNISAQNPQVATTDSIAFVKTVHDYGTIAMGGNGLCEFTFVNKGKTPLVLSNVQASCGCTAPEWTREPVLPGKSGVIKVNYNTNIVGAFTKVVTVMSNAKNSPVVLTIKGTVESKQ